MMLREKRLLLLYESMLRIRVFEEAVLRDYTENNIPGVVHLSMGQEAVAAGISLNLRDDDFIVSTHRPHAHIIAKGAPLDRCMAELWGKVTGVCHGKGGHLHLAHKPSGVLGANGVVGGGAPFAAGAAMAIQYRETDQIVVCYFGDGAVSQGAMHEALTLASVFSLPVLFVGENNGFAETTSVQFHLCGGSIADRLAGYPNLRRECVDGMDVEAVDETAGILASWIRDQQSPALLECETYRYRGHFEGDPLSYRSALETEHWRARDPIAAAERALEDMNVAPATLKTISARVSEEVARASEFAARSGFPKPEAVLEGVYS